MSMTISGSGTITGLSAGGLPDATIVQADLAANVAGNGPAFSAYASANQSITTSTFTKITLDVEEFDTNSNFASNRFTPTVAGYYSINGYVLFSGGTATNTAFNILYKNGSEFKRGAQISLNLSNNIGCSVSSVVYLNGSTDYVELYVFQNNGSSNIIVGGAAFTYFQGFLARAA